MLNANGNEELIKTEISMNIDETTIQSSKVRLK